MNYGPQDTFCDLLHAEKYRSPGESFRDAMTRIASTLSDSEEHFRAFRNILLEERFLPAGRIQAAVGSTRITTPYNCYVSGTIEDSYIEGAGSIMNRAAQAAATMRLGGGIGYDFSTLRPRGALIRKLQSHSAGPLPMMEIFDAVCRATCSSGHRRGAQMGVLRVDHPDIEDFVRAKQNETSLTGFNISVAVTDEFMEAVDQGGPFALRWGGQVYRTIEARDLWNLIMRSNYDWAEPGVLFIDTINTENNLYYCETIRATNPCGEQPLPPFGACLLGSFNLTKYLIRKPSTPSGWEFDWAQLYLDVPNIVRAMDNVIDKAKYPLFEQEQEAQAKRRMGLGICGAANAIEALAAPYGSPRFCHLLRHILSTIRAQAYRASSELAAEKGSFPLYRAESFLSSAFIQTLSEDTQELIRKNGIRNSHLISIAPTGTISLCADNISSGIEPVFAYQQKRAIFTTKGIQTYDLLDYGVRFLGVKGKRVDDCTLDDHLAVLEAAVPYVDSAISKTCNVPNNIPFDNFRDAYLRAWKFGAKGCTLYRKGCLREGILQSKDEDLEPPAVPESNSPLPLALTCELDPLTGRRNCE